MVVLRQEVKSAAGLFDGLGHIASGESVGGAVYRD
jgi:hypothetical protein